jgi:hypothetical protein
VHKFTATILVRGCEKRICGTNPDPNERITPRGKGESFVVQACAQIYGGHAGVEFFDGTNPVPTAARHPFISSPGPTVAALFRLARQEASFGVCFQSVGEMDLL